MAKPRRHITQEERDASNERRRARAKTKATPGQLKGAHSQKRMETIQENSYNLKFDERRQAIYLEMLAKTGLKMKSASTAEINYGTVCNHRKENAEFRRAEEEAIERNLERLEEIVDRRAFVGEEEFVVSKGEVVYHEGKPLKRKVFSDGLATLRLKALAPNKYRENVRVDAEFSGGVLVVPAKMSIEEWEARQRDRMDKEKSES